MFYTAQETADLVTFTEEILNEKLHFLSTYMSICYIFFSHNGRFLTVFHFTFRCFRCIYGYCVWCFCVVGMRIVSALDCKSSPGIFKRTCDLMTHIFFFGDVWVGCTYCLLEVPLSFFLIVRIQEILLLKYRRDTLLSHLVEQLV